MGTDERERVPTLYRRMLSLMGTFSGLRLYLTSKSCEANILGDVVGGKWSGYIAYCQCWRIACMPMGCPLGWN